MGTPERDDLRADAAALFAAAVAGVLPSRLLARVDWDALAARPLAGYARIVVVGAGKAALAMAGEAEAALAARRGPADSGRWGGEVVVPHGYRPPNAPGSPDALHLPNDFRPPGRRALPAGVRAPAVLRVVEAGHPIPDAAGAGAAERAPRAAGACRDGDLLLVLLSGGASALWPAFAAGVPADDARTTFALLLAGGAPIDQVNAVRKHLSALGGGRLAADAFPADVAAVALSDVPGDDPAVIGSGPATADPSTFADAVAVLRAHGLWARVPASVRGHLERGAAGGVPDTPKPGDPRLARARTHVIGGVRDALVAARAAAERLGYRVVAAEERLTGEARDAGAHVARAAVVEALGIAATPNAPAAPVCLLWGGETTVTVCGGGRGGRNQELALAAALALDGWRRRDPAAARRADVAVLSGGTDGVDGPTDAAGAVVTPHTVAAAAARGLDAELALAANDSHTFFAALHAAAGGPPGDALGCALLSPGPTHTNVADVQIALVRPRPGA